MRTSHTEPFAQAIATLQKQFPNAPHSWCYGRTARDHKDLYLAARIEAASHQAGELARSGLSQFSNSTELDPAASPIPKAQQAEMYRMNGCTDDAEMRAAFRGNNGKWSPVNWNDVFAALVKFHASEKTNYVTREAGSLLDAVHKVRDQYPALYAQVNGWNISPQAVAAAVTAEATDPKAELANTATALVGTKASQVAARWRIPSATPSEFTNVLETLGSLDAPLDYKRTFNSLVAFHQKDRRITYMQSVNFVQHRHPDLARCFSAPKIDVSGIQK